MNMLNNFIAIEGNIGVGKTTLATSIAKDFKSRLILEQFSENPFLSKFYRDPDKYAFSLELFFMAERYNQLKKEQEQDMFSPFVISDYLFIKSKLFAHNNLKSHELQLFIRLFDMISPSFSAPDLVIYLHADIEKLQYNIKKRGRPYESTISNDYLKSIQDRYLDYLRKQNDFPALILDVSNIDIKNNTSIYNRIKEIIQLEHKLGTSQLEI